MLILVVAFLSHVICVAETFHWMDAHYSSHYASLNASVVVVAWIIYISHTNAEINKRDLKLYQPATAIDRNDKLMHASGRVANFSTGGSHNLNTL